MKNISLGKVWIIDDAGLDHRKEIAIYDEENISYVLSTQKSLEKDLERFGRYADVIVAEASTSIDEKLIKKLNNCKTIISFGIGFNHIDLEVARKSNIEVTNLGDYCSNEVADHTLSLILTLLRRLVDYNKDLKAGNWESISLKPLHRFETTTIGLLGFGSISQKVAKRLMVFGFKVVAHDEYVDEKVFDVANVTSVSFEELLTRSNLLSLHVPLTNDTENMLNEESMREMTKNSMIVNTCRGGIIDEYALAKLINEGHLSGAGLDVFLSEPPDMENPIFLMDEIITTPHAAYYSVESVEEMQIRTAENVKKALKNEDVLYRV